MIKTAFSSTDIKRVTTLRTIADAMNENDIYKKMLGEVAKALKIYFTFPVIYHLHCRKVFLSITQVKNVSTQYNDSITTKQPPLTVYPFARN